jgi:hypothetical protein
MRKHLTCVHGIALHNYSRSADRAAEYQEKKRKKIALAESSGSNEPRAAVSKRKKRKVIS